MGDVIHIGPTGPKTTSVEFEGIRTTVCHHRSVSLFEASRKATCANCGVELDAFKCLVDYARGEREFHDWSSEAERFKKRVAQLQDDERRLKARIRNASKKDVEAAVLAERKKWQERVFRIEKNAKEIEKAAGVIYRAVTGEKRHRCTTCRDRGRVPGGNRKHMLYGERGLPCPKCFPEGERDA